MTTQAQTRTTLPNHGQGPPGKLGWVYPNIRESKCHYALIILWFVSQGKNVLQTFSVHVASRPIESLLVLRQADRQAHFPARSPELRAPPPPPPRVTFRQVVAPLRGPGQSPVLPFACCVGLLLSPPPRTSPGREQFLRHKACGEEQELWAGGRITKEEADSVCGWRTISTDRQRSQTCFQRSLRSFRLPSPVADPSLFQQPLPRKCKNNPNG